MHITASALPHGLQDVILLILLLYGSYKIVKGKMRHYSLKFKLLTGLFAVILSSILFVSLSSDTFRTEDPAYYKPYLDYLNEVYLVMDRDYYLPVTRYSYDRFIKEFKYSILSQLKSSDRFEPLIAWRGSNLLVQGLRNPEDSFTNFIPPPIAEKYSEEIYGYQTDLGINGNLTSTGFLIDTVEKKSDAFRKGIHGGLIILEINGRDVQKLTKKELEDLFHPPIGTIVDFKIYFPVENKVLDYSVTCEEYFKETVFNIPTGITGIYCLKIDKFNKETAKDLNRHIAEFLKNGDIKFLILDVRGNPGGPPLAVREIAGTFLGPGYKLAYYLRKAAAVAGLISPESDILYKGPLILLIDGKSGSASELLAGILKKYKRAVIVGKRPTAGMAFLKGTHKFEDGSMLAMITGMSHLYDGEKLGPDGVMPNIIIPSDVDDQLDFVLKKLTRE